MDSLCRPLWKVMVIRAKCRNTCEQRTEEISVAFDETIMAEEERNIREVLDGLFAVMATTF